MGWLLRLRYQKSKLRIETIAARMIDAPKPVTAEKAMIKMMPKSRTEKREILEKILRARRTRMVRL